MTSGIQQECFISAQHSNAKLKLVLKLAPVVNPIPKTFYARKLQLQSRHKGNFQVCTTVES